MRIRYCFTISSDVTRPSAIAFCMSGMEASTTLNGGCAGAGGAGRSHEPSTRGAAVRSVVVNNRFFMITLPDEAGSMSEQAWATQTKRPELSFRPFDLTQSPFNLIQSPYGIFGGGWRFFVSCSNA